MKLWIKKAIKKFDCTSAVLSEIRMYRDCCITKQEFEEKYKTNEKSETRMDLSVGEDLESFIERTKHGKIKEHTKYMMENEEYKSSFLLCLLDEEERKKLHFHGRDWRVFDSNVEFVESKCYRHTYFLGASSISSDSDSDSDTDSDTDMS